jgi:acetyl esterase/lipase
MKDILKAHSLETLNMADFSEFGTPSKEWTEHQARYGPFPPAPIETQTAEEIQLATNQGREKISSSQMLSEGKSACLCYLITQISYIKLLDLYSKVNIRTVDVPTRDNNTIPVRVYSPIGQNSTQEKLLPVYIYYHGGGLIYGSLDSEDATCSRIIVNFPEAITIFSVCYRHTPQVTYPTPQQDAVDALEYLLANLESFGGDVARVAVGGVSAGAALAVAAVKQYNTKTVKEKVKIKGQLLCIPWFTMQPSKFPYDLLVDREKSSYVQCAGAPIVPIEVLEWFSELLHITNEENDASLLVDIRDERGLADMPTTAFMISGMDPLRDDGMLYAQRLHESG